MELLEPEYYELNFRCKYAVIIIKCGKIEHQIFLKLLDCDSMKVLIVFDTRPKTVKMAPVVSALSGSFNVKVCVTF